jgi:RNA polymerase sigma-70 factor (ECF subfamily)
LIALLLIVFGVRRHTASMVISPELGLELPSACEEPGEGGSANAGVHHEPRDFPAVYQAHFDFVWRSLRRLGVPESAVDDAHQEVFLIAYRRLGEFHGRSKVKTWLFGIALNVVRHQRRSFQRDQSHEPLSETVPAQQPGPLESAANSEARATLEAFLAHLDPDKRAVFILAELEQMTVVEVAEATQTNLRTVYSRLRAARQEFEQAVARHRARDAWRNHA